MIIRRIMAAVMACSIVCAVPAPMGTYQPGYKLTANAVDVVDSGKCGDDLTWEIDSEGTLTISGTGEMYDNYTTNDSKYWSDSNIAKKSDIKTVIINDGVTSVGSAAFFECENLSKVVLPDSMVSIGYASFARSGLEEINIPASVKECCVSTVDEVTSGIIAFDDTPWLEVQREKNPLVIVNNIVIDARKCEGDIIIPDNVERIDDYAFMFAGEKEPLLNSVTIPGSVKTISGNSFLWCGLQKLIIENGVERIEDGAFHGCSNLSEVIISESVECIRNAFHNCSELKKFTVLNPECELENLFGLAGAPEGSVFYDGVICGYEGSTAQKFATDNDLAFESLGKYPPETTTTAKPATTTTTTTTAKSATTTTKTTTAKPVTTTTTAPITTKVTTSTTAKPTTTTITEKPTTTKAATTTEKPATTEAPTTTNEPMTTKAEEKYSLEEFDISGLFGEGEKCWEVTKTDAGTYILRGGFPHEYIRKHKDGSETTEMGLAQHFAVVDENGNFIIPWFESDYDGREARRLTYADGVYSLCLPDADAYMHSLLEGSYCEYYDEEGNPLFEHDDWLCASVMTNGTAWVGVAGEIEDDELYGTCRKVKEYQLIDRNGNVLKTTKGVRRAIGNSVDLSELYFDSESNVYKEFTEKLNEAGLIFDGEFHNGLARVYKQTETGKYRSGCVNEEGDLVIPALYQSIRDISEDGVLVMNEDLKCGIVGRDGEPLTEFIYEYFGSSRFTKDGYAIMIEEMTEGGIGYIYNLLDTKGNKVTLPFDTEKYSFNTNGYYDGWFIVYSNSVSDQNTGISYSMINFNGDTISLPEGYDYSFGSDGLVVATESGNSRYFNIVSNASEESVVRLGDVNNDELVDASDASEILVEYANTSTGGDAAFTGEQFKTADVNFDGFVDSNDASGVLVYYAYVQTGGEMESNGFFKALAAGEEF